MTQRSAKCSAIARWLLGVTLAAATAMTAMTAGAQALDARLPANPGVLTGTLKKAYDTGALTIGYREAALPFSYLNPRGEPIGYSIDLCRDIVEAAGQEVGKDLEIRWVPLSSEQRIEAVVSGKVDIECGSTTNNTERQKEVAFSPVIFVSGTKLMVRRGSDIKSFRDLKGRTVAVIAGTTNAKAMADLSKKFNLDLNLISGKDRADTLAMLTSGRAEAFASDDVLLYGVIAASHAEKDYMVVGDFLSYDPYGLMFRRGDPDFARLVDSAMRAMAGSRELEHYYNQWFMRKLRTGERLGLPMSPQLEEIFRAMSISVD